MTKLKFLEDNQELTEDGYRTSEAMSYFNDEAWEADCVTDDGEVFTEAIEYFWEMANRHPRSIEESKLYNNKVLIREAVLTLFTPKGYLNDYQKDWIMEALTSAMTKKQIIDAFLCYGEAVNEYFRLKWIVAEHGGWKKPRSNT